MVTDAGGEKMSKSVGNFVNLTDLLEQSRRARLPLARRCSRTTAAPMQVTDATIERAVNTLAGLDAFGRRFAQVTPAPRRRGGDRERSSNSWTTTSTRRRPPRLIFDLVREANKAADAGDDKAAEARGGYRARDAAA